MEQGEPETSNFYLLFRWQKNVDLLITIKKKKKIILFSQLHDISNPTSRLADNTKALVISSF